MFYLKDGKRRLYIKEDNVYTICPVCGKEHSVDIKRILEDKETCVQATTVLCSGCSINMTRRKEHAVNSSFKKVLRAETPGL